MPDALGTLCEANKNLRDCICRLRPEYRHVSALRTGDLLRIRGEISRGRDCSRQMPTILEAIGKEKKELLEYQSNLEQLRRLLPHVHARLSAEKSRLLAARTHASAAAHWANSRAGQSLNIR